MKRRALIIMGCLSATASIAADVSISIVGQNDAPLADAVAYLNIRGAAGIPSAPKPAQVDQMNKTFLPNVSIVQTGTPVSFPNSDNFRHHVYSFSGEYQLPTWHPGAQSESTVQIFRVSGSAVTLTARLTTRSIDELRREVGLAGAR